MSSILASHNKAILRSEENEENLCSCRRKDECPVGNKCMTQDVVYQAKVRRLDNNKEETYIGLTSNTFKQRWTAHKSSFRLEAHEKDTRLSTYIWKLKREQVNFELNWRIVAKTRSYSPVSKKCMLCIKDKFYTKQAPRIFYTLSTQSQVQIIQPKSRGQKNFHFTDRFQMFKSKEYLRYSLYFYNA